MLTLTPTTYDGTCLAFIGKEIILKDNGSALTFSDLQHIAQAADSHDIFIESDTHICAMKVKGNDTSVLPPGYTTQTLRLYNAAQDDDEVLRTSRAKALAEWLAGTRYCSRCGKPLLPHSTLTALQCPECNNLIFPRIEPCIIVLVSRGKEMLLARHVQRNQEIYACIAGFIEAGESVEHAVEREIFEETGIRVKNVTYFGSQSWPYPSQLMLAFTAEYASGELKLQEDELSDAGWFTPDNCPATPPPGSIAYQLIQHAKAGASIKL